jgi:hypothetical protein
MIAYAIGAHRLLVAAEMAEAPDWRRAGLRRTILVRPRLLRITTNYDYGFPRRRRCPVGLLLTGQLLYIVVTQFHTDGQPICWNRSRSCLLHIVEWAVVSVTRTRSRFAVRPSS